MPTAPRSSEDRLDAAALGDIYRGLRSVELDDGDVLPPTSRPGRPRLATPRTDRLGGPIRLTTAAHLLVEHGHPDAARRLPGAELRSPVAESIERRPPGPRR